MPDRLTETQTKPIVLWGVVIKDLNSSTGIVTGMEIVQIITYQDHSKGCGVGGVEHGNWRFYYFIRPK